MKGCVIEHVVLRKPAPRFEWRATEKETVQLLPSPFLETDQGLFQNTPDRHRRKNLQSDRSARGISNEQLHSTLLTRDATGDIWTRLNKDAYRG